MFYQIFFSPQVKPCAIVTSKHGIYQLPHKLLNNLLRRLHLSLQYAQREDHCIGFKKVFFKEMEFPLEHK